MIFLVFFLERKQKLQVHEIAALHDQWYIHVHEHHMYSVLTYMYMCLLGFCGNTCSFKDVKDNKPYLGCMHLIVSIELLFLHVR